MPRPLWYSFIRISTQRLGGAVEHVCSSSLSRSVFYKMVGLRNWGVISIRAHQDVSFPRYNIPLTCLRVSSKPALNPCFKLPHMHAYSLNSRITELRLSHKSGSHRQRNSSASYQQVISQAILIDLGICLWIVYHVRTDLIDLGTRHIGGQCFSCSLCLGSSTSKWSLVSECNTKKLTRVEANQWASVACLLKLSRVPKAVSEPKYSMLGGPRQDEYS
ncbi:hypothetical protein Hypma_012705 [Hypsizygus marmoreus]|uniref:Uncharacterized protein n=1 Tax=Hypsizygus marmoreus TaxID=39966 RepID=A0A369JIG0_HYPMA|nr:hypothetical protein Hypma_012705 [Hypsizygus marmoreus]